MSRHLTPLKILGTAVGLFLLTIVILYIVNAWVRHGNPSSLKGPMLLSLLCLILLTISGWLGGKMTFEYGVGVNPDGEGLRGGTSASPRNRHVEA